MNTKSKAAIVLCLSLCMIFLLVGPASAAITDIQGHWAATQISSWVGQGFITGYPDGSFKPDNNITRAEFFTLVNKSFAFNERASISFSDVSSTDWYKVEIEKAKAAGYITGYEDGTMKPNATISRQEAAVIIAKLLKLDPVSTGLEGKFNDAADIPQWSKGLIGAVTAKGCMTGYPDHTFQPYGLLKRAEAVVTLDRALNARTTSESYNVAGTYGPATGTETINGDVTINVPGVTLQNMIITGDLLLAEGIGEGDATLKNVTVKGKTTIKGGGVNSIYIDDCVMDDMIIQKNVRVVASGDTKVSVTRLESGATLVSEVDSFGNVIASAEIPAGAQITLEGNFSSVVIAADDVNLDITGGAVTSLTVSEGTTGTNINVASGASVTTMNLDAPVAVTGTGTIGTANITSNGVTVEQKPSDSNISAGVTTNVGGETQSGGTTSSGGGDSNAPTITSASIQIEGEETARVITITGGKEGTLDLSSLTGTEKIEDGTIVVSENATFTVTGPDNVVDKLSAIDVLNPKSLTGGTEETIDVIEYIISLFTLNELKDFLGGELTISGTLTDSHSNTNDLTLTITLP